MSAQRTYARAVAFSTLTPFFGTLGAAIAKHLQHQVSLNSILLAQYVVCMVALLPWMIRSRFGGLATTQLPMHVARGLAGYACYVAHYVSVAMIPLVDAVTLRNTAPLFVPFLVWMVFGVRPMKRIVWVAAFGFLGVLVMLRPSLTMQTGHVWGVAAGATLALSMVLTRKLSGSESRNQILFYYFLVSMLCSIPAVLLDGLELVTDPTSWFLLIADGVAVYLALQFYTVAFMSAPTTLVAPFSYFGVMFSGVWSALFWGEYPDWVSLVGIALIVVSGIATIRIGSRQVRSEFPPAG